MPDSLFSCLYRCALKKSREDLNSDLNFCFSLSLLQPIWINLSLVFPTRPLAVLIVMNMHQGEPGRSQLWEGGGCPNLSESLFGLTCLLLSPLLH